MLTRLITLFTLSISMLLGGGTALAQRVDPAGTSILNSSLASLPRTTRVGAAMSLQEAVLGMRRRRGASPSARSPDPAANRTAQPNTAP